MNIVKLSDIQEAMHNALNATFTDPNYNSKELYFQQRFEKHHECQIIKSYSQESPVISTIASIKYWHALQFKNAHDITMFVLKWT